MADVHRKILDVRPFRSSFLNFEAVFRKFWPNNRLVLPFLGLSSLGNPGSADDIGSQKWPLSPVASPSNGEDSLVLPHMTLSRFTFYHLSLR